MKSPQLSTIIIAVIFSIIAFIISNSMTTSPAVIAVIVFISTFISPLIGAQPNSSSTDPDEEIKTLYVGNLPYRANESIVRELFANYGNVHSVRLMKDKHTGKRRGFGFVEMSANDLDKAISALNDTEFQQRTLKVREAKERPERTDNVE
ncbi:MAG: RNA-binding protein [Colwellia sp.]